MLARTRIIKILMRRAWQPGHENKNLLCLQYGKDCTRIARKRSLDLCGAGRTKPDQTYITDPSKIGVRACGCRLLGSACHLACHAATALRVLKRLVGGWAVCSITDSRSRFTTTRYPRPIVQGMILATQLAHKLFVTLCALL